MVWHAAAERVVTFAVDRLLARALLGFVGAPAGLFARLARGRCADLHRAARDLAPARGFGQAHQVVGRLVDRLQMALVLELLARRGDVGVPALGHAPARKLHVALVKRRLYLQQEHLLLDVEDHSGHEHNTLPARP